MKLFRKAVVPVLLTCASGLTHAQHGIPAEDPARRYAGIIDESSRRHGVDGALVHAVILAESSYDPNAVSPQGALGLMQLMPETARRYGVANALDPAQNVEGGVRMLHELLEIFGRDVELALAAYNAGTGAVMRAGHRVPDNEETSAFVPRVLGYYRQYHAASQPPCTTPLVEAIALADGPRPMWPSGHSPEGGGEGDPRSGDGKHALALAAGRRPRRWHLARIRGSGAAASLLGLAAEVGARDNANRAAKSRRSTPRRARASSARSATTRGSTK